jgi:cytochrome c oxidase subunit 3
MTDYVAGDRAISDVPRTTRQTDAAGVARAVSRRYGPPAAWWGMLMLIASEGTLFGSFIGTYYYLRFKTVHWPPLGIPEPKVVVPLILVGCLAATSVPMQLASLSARKGRLAATRLAIVVALVVQCGYFAFEMHDFQDQLRQFSPTTNAYGSIYYTLLGADHGHVFLGILFNLWLLWKLARGLTTYRMNAVQAITWYWHAVNLVTLLVIGTLLSAAV